MGGTAGAWPWGWEMDPFPGELIILGAAPSTSRVTLEDRQGNLRTALRQQTMEGLGRG